MTAQARRAAPGPARQRQTPEPVPVSLPEPPPALHQVQDVEDVQDEGIPLDRVRAGADEALLDVPVADPVLDRPPLERLRAVAAGRLDGDVAVRAAAELSGAQRATLLAGGTLLAGVLARLRPDQALALLERADVPPKDAVWHLSLAGYLGALDTEAWATLLLEASAAEFAALAGSEVHRTLLGVHCDPAVLAMAFVAQGEPGAMVSLFTAPVQVAALLEELGPRALLAVMVRTGEIGRCVAALEQAGLMWDLLNALPEGAALGADGQASLGAVFDAIEDGELRLLVRAFERRFGLQLQHAGPEWTAHALRRAWGVLEALPAAAVEANDEIDALVRDGAAPGSGEYRGEYMDQVFMSFDDPDADGWWTDRMVNVFDRVLRHEVGHAVDARIGASQPGGYVRQAAGWEEYEGADAFVEAIVEAGGGMAQYGEHADLYARALRHAVEKWRGFVEALEEIDPTAEAPTSFTGPIAAVSDPAWFLGPWNGEAWTPVGGRCFHPAGPGSAIFLSFSEEALARKVTDYQFRAPGEWFAEAYQVFYGDAERGQAPGTTLRSKDPQTAEWFVRHVDHEHSLPAETGQEEK